MSEALQPSGMDAPGHGQEDNAAAQAETVPALRRAVRILDFVSAAGAPPTAADLARALGLPKSSAHGLLATMLELGLLARAGDGTFRLGAHPMHWANGFLAQFDLVGEFQRYFAEQAELSRHTITLSVLEGRDVIYLACRNSADPLGFTFRIGMRLPAPFTATGKILLSALPDAALRQRFGQHWPAALTPHSVAGLPAFLAEMRDTRARGFSIDEGQVREGMHCIGAAIRDFSGEPVAGIAVSLLEHEATPAAMQATGTQLAAVAAALSRRLGMPG